MAHDCCSGCGTELPTGANYCPECGAGAKKAIVHRRVIKGKKQSTSLRDNFIIIGLLVVVAVAYYIMRRPEKPPQMQTRQQLTDPHGDAEAMMGAIPDLPTDYEGLVQMGDMTMDHGNYPIAAECYRRALEISPDSPDVRTDFGACLHGMGLSDRAIEEFTTVLAEHPEHGIAHYNLGIVYRGLGDNDSARVYWQKYLQMEPNGSASESAREFLKMISG